MRGEARLLPHPSADCRNTEKRGCSHTPQLTAATSKWPFQKVDYSWQLSVIHQPIRGQVRFSKVSSSQQHVFVFRMMMTRMTDDKSSNHPARGLEWRLLFFFFFLPCVGSSADDLMCVCVFSSTPPSPQTCSTCVCVWPFGLPHAACYYSRVCVCERERDLRI